MTHIFVGVDGTTPDLFRNKFFEPTLDLPMSFVNTFYQSSVAQPDFKKFYAGPDLGGFGTVDCVSEPLDFIMGCVKKLRGEKPRITIVGYSRGSYAAIRIAQGLGKAKVPVYFLGLLDTVKVTITHTETAIGQVIDKYDDSFDTNAETKRRYDKSRSDFDAIVKKHPQAIMAAQGLPSMGTIRSSVAKEYGRKIQNESYVADPRDRARGSYNYVDDIGHFVVSGNVENAISVQRDEKFRSREGTMGVSPVEYPGGKIYQPARFPCTHACMGGMPFRGDFPMVEITRSSEWVACGKIAGELMKYGTSLGVISRFDHPTLRWNKPPQWWLINPLVKDQYMEYVKTFNKSDGLTPDQDQEIKEWRKVEMQSRMMMFGP